MGNKIFHDEKNFFSQKKKTRGKVEFLKSNRHDINIRGI